MVAQNEQIAVHKGDVLGLHYPNEEPQARVAVYDNTMSSCCGLTDANLSRFHAAGFKDDELFVGIVMPIELNTGGKLRLPALEPLLSGKHVLVFFDITNVLCWFIWFKIASHLPHQIFKIDI